ncbi:hypothetical protein ABT301_26415 [Streptomyces sp. NPDC000987]|uniref:hypothetical protein n=1 Tax=Streptomyces sp. NPDC000987 TaxID=3154374 RepID=UPI00331F0BB6
MSSTSPAPGATPEPTDPLARRTWPRLYAALLLAGQVLYLAVTQLHTGGDAHDHHAVFGAHVDSAVRALSRLGRYAGTAVLLAALLALFLAPRTRRSPRRFPR